jgi:broad specificity phosphatase PhoE
MAPHPFRSRPNRRQALQGLLAVSMGAYRPSTQAATEEALFWQEARAGGGLLLMRHGATVAGIGDPPGFRLNDCRTQRNLSEAGRQASRALGQRFVAEGVALAAVYSSAWCRCLDTARLAFDPHYPSHQIWPALNSFFQGQGDRDAQTRDVLQRAATLQAPANWMLVTHQVNITALTGTVPAMGEVFLTRWEASQPDRLVLRARLAA